MVTRNILVSDLSGEPDAITTRLGVSGEWYEVDVTATEKQELEELLEVYISAGRKATPPKKRIVPETTAEEREEMRAWAREQGFEFADRGKIPNAIYRAYQDAHAEAAS